MEIFRIIKSGTLSLGAVNGFILPLIVLFSFSCKDSSTDSNELTNEYSLVWQDEFDGDTISASNWTFQLGTGSQFGLVGWGNNELQSYTARERNAYIEDGFLVIEAHKESFMGQPYTSARIVTKDKKFWKYGKIEIKAKMPETQGLWPALWMLPQENKYGGWPASGEIDIVELVGHQPDVAHGTIHYGNAYNDKGSSSGKIKDTKSTFATDFHVYSIGWDSRGIQWLLDGEPYHSVTPEDVEPYNWPFDEAFYLLFNVAVGGNWPGYPDDTTIMPQRMLVDYVRVFQKAE